MRFSVRDGLTGYVYPRITQDVPARFQVSYKYLFTSFPTSDITVTFQDLIPPCETSNTKSFVITVEFFTTSDTGCSKEKYTLTKVTIIDLYPVADPWGRGEGCGASGSWPPLTPLTRCTPKPQLILVTAFISCNMKINAVMIFYLV